MSTPAPEEKVIAKSDPRMERCKGIIEAQLNRFMELLPDKVSPDRLMRVYASAFSRNPRLLEATPGSIVLSLSTASEFGLEPNTPLGECYLIPYRNKNGNMEAQFQMGYRGVMELARRAGVGITCAIIHENDVFDYSLGLNINVIHKPVLAGRGEVIGYYAIAHIPGTAPGICVMNLEEIEAHARRYSKAYQHHLQGKFSDTPWKEKPGENGRDGMALKTVILGALSYAPKSIYDRTIGALEGKEEREEEPEATAKRGMDAVKAKLGGKADAKAQEDYVDGTASPVDQAPVDDGPPQDDLPWEEPPKPEPERPSSTKPEPPSKRDTLMADIERIYGDSGLSVADFDALCGGTAVQMMDDHQLADLKASLEKAAKRRAR